MSSMNPARRRAERFEAAIEDPSSAGLDPRMLELVELVGALRETPQPTARPAFVSDLRASLLLAAETELVPAAPERRATPVTTRPRRERRIAVALGGLAIVGATTSMAVAAQSALPGDSLYPLKRAIEDADTSLSADDRKGTELLDHASSRLREVHDLSQDDLGTDETREIERTLSTFTAQADEASDLLMAQYDATGSARPISQLRTFTGESLTRLDRLQDALPETLQPALQEAARTLLRIDQVAAEACPDCGGLGITDIPTGLVSAGIPLGEALTPVVETQAVPAPAAPTPDATKPGKGDARPSSPAAPQPSAAPTPAVGDLGGAAADPLGGQSGAAGAGGGKPSAAAPGGVVGQLGDTVGGIVKGVTGGGKTGQAGGTTSTPPAPLPSLGEVVEGTLGTVEGVTGSLLGPLLGQPTSTP